jgi:general secretion pathway protein L
VPAPLLLAPPPAGFVRRDRGALADYRGPAAAFALEPELAEALVGDAQVAVLDAAAFEADLATAVAAPALDLRQGPFARRRPWRVERPRLRRLAIYAIALALLTLAVQVATILAYTFAADRVRTQTDALAVRNAGRSVDAGPGFGAFAALLFDAVRATPNAELAAIDYRPDGSLVATVTADNAATLSALQGRLEAGGVRVMAGESRTDGGRMTTRLSLSSA